ncbi:MAG: class I SAM-dependent methyltransferase [Myxococcota bacterium]|nr:class I SAM-dependent methyltransferase [Myxococcota bacterium]
MIDLSRFIAAQLGRPSGLFGRVVMTRVLDYGNAEMIDACIAALELRRDDTYLDVGFGGGGALERAARRVDDGHVYGVDFSPDVVVAGQRRFRREIAAGRMTLLTADIGELPLRDALVSAVSTINTIYFWPDPATAARSIRRVLSPGGRLAIGFTGADKMRQWSEISQHGFRLWTGEQVRELLEGAGFDAVEVQVQAGRRTKGDFVAIARRP